jgi:hypothetical protein
MIETITMLDFAVIAAPLTLAALALLFFGRRNIYRQMDNIPAAANARGIFVTAQTSAPVIPPPTLHSH